jgi:quinohemoprotein amine dehydrogenase
MAGLAWCDETPPAGIPIDNQLTIAKCGGCHPRDARGMMTRISQLRTTPEVWQEIIKRMIRLNGMSATPEQVRDIVRYLSGNNGLAPEEAQPIFWEAEHRLFRDQEDPTLVPAALQHVCNICHQIGRVLGQRRSADDYAKLATLHVALFPYTDIGVFRPYGPQTAAAEIPVTQVTLGPYETGLNYPTANTAAPDGKDPVDIALEYLSKNQPLITPEWTAWKAAMHTPKLAGTWSLSGYQKGQGKVFGTMTVKPGASDDEFVTSIELQYATSGRVVARTGKGYVYAGYSWRGRSKTSTPSEGRDSGISPVEMKEAIFVARDGASMQGRFFWGGYDEFGIDVKMSRAGAQPKVLGTNRFSIKTASTGEMKIYGVNLPANLTPADVDLGSGIKVTKVSSSSGTAATLQYDAAAGLPVGMRDISVRGSAAVNAFAVYDKVSYIKVMPDASFARLGGTIAAKQYAQFEAVAFANGPDGKPETADDIALGPVTANWATEEFFSTPNDDDVKFVGSISDSGLFTPAIEGPNPLRKKQSNNFGTDNYGDVWVTASAKLDDGPLLRARSYLAVGVPLYIHYDQPEVSQ